MGPGIVSAESSLCATIHWDLARVLGFVGTHPTPNPSQGCLVAKHCLALDIPSPLSLHSNSSFLFTLFQVLGICCLSFLAVFDLIPSPFSLPFKFFFPLNSVWSYCHLLSILIHSKLSSKCYLFFPSLHSKTCSSSLSLKSLLDVVYPFQIPTCFRNVRRFSLSHIRSPSSYSYRMVSYPSYFSSLSQYSYCIHHQVSTHYPLSLRDLLLHSSKPSLSVSGNWYRRTSFPTELGGGGVCSPLCTLFVLLLSITCSYSYISL